MFTVHSLPKFCARVALLTTCACSVSYLHADDGAPPEGAPPVSQPQPAQQSDVNARVQGRIIIVEPDGTRREYSFGPEIPGRAQPKFDMLMPNPTARPWAFGAGDAAPRGQAIGALIQDPHVVVGDYMIGLDCVEADAALRAQLGLGEKGLVVRSPLEKSPAAAAGFQAHDVLTRAGDKDLAKVQDLLDAVQAADGKPISITLLRGGREQTLEVTPVKRLDVTLAPPGADSTDIDVYIRKQLEHPDGVRFALPHTLRMRAVRPGVVFEDRVEVAGLEKVKEIETQIQKLTEQVQALQKSIDELKEKQN